MGQTASLFKVATGNKNCQWIYRFWANPGRPWGGIVPPSPVLAPESALGSRPRVALSFAQVFSVYLAGLWLGKFLLLGLGSPPGVGRRQLLSPRGPDGLRATGQLLRWRDVGDRAMQPHRVVVGHELGDQPPSVLQAQRGLNSYAPSFQGLEPPLDLAVALRIEWRRSDVSHSTYADELLEVSGDELRAVVRDDPGLLAGILLPSPLDDRLHLGFLHGLADLPVDDEPAVAVEDAAQEEEGPADVEIGDIDVPVLMRPQGLLEALSLLGRLAASGSQLARRPEHAVDAGGADGHDVGVEHHVGQPPISFQGVEGMKGDDRGLLPILEPKIAGEGGVVLVGSSQPSAPAAELAHGNPQPADQEQDRQVRAASPALDELDDRIADGLGNPGSVQSSPRSFFSLICSSMSSERTSCLRCSFCSSRAILRSLSSLGRRERCSNAAAAFSKNSFCQR